MSFARLLRERKGTAAVEFALVAPVFILLLLSIAGYAFYLSAAYSVQQIAADAARTALAGLNASERRALAGDFIESSTLEYHLLDPAKLTFSLVDDQQNTEQFTVTVEYDASHLPIWALYSFAMPSSKITRFSTIRIGGI